MISVFGKAGRRRACASLTSRALHCTKYEVQDRRTTNLREGEDWRRMMG